MLKGNPVIIHGDGNFLLDNDLITPSTDTTNGTVIVSAGQVEDNMFRPETIDGEGKGIVILLNTIGSQGMDNKIEIQSDGSVW